MPCLPLHPTRYAELSAALAGSPWLVACLCAAWCRTCDGYQATFAKIAEKHPDKCFLWIDIEDHADLVGDLDVENFPTLLIQHTNTVAFFGTVLPDQKVVERLLAAQFELEEAELLSTAMSSGERREWQSTCDLRDMLRAAGVD